MVTRNELLNKLCSMRVIGNSPPSRVETPTGSDKVIRGILSCLTIVMFIRFWSEPDSINTVTWMDSLQRPMDPGRENWDDLLLNPLTSILVSTGNSCFWLDWAWGDVVTFFATIETNTRINTLLDSILDWVRIILSAWVPLRVNLEDQD